MFHHIYRRTCNANTANSSCRSVTPPYRHCSSQLFAIAKMISDEDLYKLAIFLGSAAMVLIVGYHFLEVNADKTAAPQKKKQ